MGVGDSVCDIDTEELAEELANTLAEALADTDVEALCDFEVENVGEDESDDEDEGERAGEAVTVAVCHALDDCDKVPEIETVTTELPELVPDVLASTLAELVVPTDKLADELLEGEVESEELMLGVRNGDCAATDTRISTIGT